MKLIVGLNVSSTELDVRFLTDNDNLPVLKEVGFENDQIGATHIKDYILHYVKWDEH